MGDSVQVIGRLISQRRDIYLLEATLSVAKQICVKATGKFIQPKGGVISVSCRFELTVICDNHAKNELLSEHGLSFYILADGLTILFDTGSGETLLPNAMKLGIDLAKCSHLVLSHGHYDHSGDCCSGAGEKYVLFGDCTPVYSVGSL